MKRYTSILATALVLSAVAMGSVAHAATSTSTSEGSYAGALKRLSETSTSQSLEKLRKQIEGLLEQIRALDKQINGGNGTGTPRSNDDTVSDDPVVCRWFENNRGNLSRGSRGEGVRNVQTYLAKRGYLRDDERSGFYGERTEAAVREWQKKYGVASGTASTGAGMWGPRTRSEMMRRCGTGGGVVSTNTFRLSPAVGKAPLKVEVAGVPASVLKKMNECKYSIGRNGTSGNGLSVDWGDGSTAPAAQTSSNNGKSCADEVKKHTYRKPGTYTAKIRSWKPGPTDAPVTEWEGTARVTVTASSTPVACTREYAPVCGQLPMPACPANMACAQVMPQPVTYGNNCMMKAAGATLIKTGACTTQ